jgi:hypothetical protein
MREVLQYLRDNRSPYKYKPPRSLGAGDSSRAAGYGTKSLCLVFVLFSAAQAFAWTDGELLIWISSNRPFHALSNLGNAFEKEV